MTMRSYLLLGGSALALSIALGSVASPAQAACVQSGSTVTCTDSDEDGFSGGNNLTLSVASTAFVQSFYDGNPSPFCASFRSAIQVGQNARITNAGEILGRGNCGLGIDAGSGLVLTNTGQISTDSETAFAILALNNFDVSNQGTLRTVNIGSIGFVGTSGGRFTNTSTGIIETTGADSAGLFVDDTNTITNAGRITTSNTGSFGMDVGASNTVTNSGTISTTGIAASGVRMRGNTNTFTNSGTITTLPTGTPRDGEDSIGVLSDADNTITNTGSIAGDYAGVLLGGTRTTLTNSGTISARNPTAATQPGAAVLVTSGLSVINNTGTIRGVGSAALRATNTGAIQLTNSGRIEGDIVLGNVGRSLAVTLDTGGVVTGTIFGSTDGLSNLNLKGSGTLSNPIVNMQFLLQQGTEGTWVLGRRYDFKAVLMSVGTMTLTDGLRIEQNVAVLSGRLNGVGAITGINNAPTTAPALQVLSGALSPGLTSQAGSFLSIDGTARFESASRIELDVDATATDRFIATGILRSGANIALTYGGTPVRDGQTFNIMSAASFLSLTNQATCAGTLQEGAAIGAGCFTLSDNSPYFIRSSATVSATTVTARIQRLPYASVAQTPEELSIAQSLDRALAAGTNPLSLPSRLDGLTASDAQKAIGSLTTDSPAAAQTWGLYAGQSVIAGLAPWLENANTNNTSGTWRTWGNVFLRDGDSGPKTNAANFDYEMKGLLAGADYAVSDTARIGVMASHVEGETFFAAGSATNNLESTSLGVYVAQSWDAWQISAGVLAADGDLRSTRANIPTDPLALVLGTPNAKTDTGSESAFARVNYKVEAGAWHLMPAANVTYVKAKVGAINENMAGGLVTQRETATALRSDIGARAIAITGPVHLSVGAFWSHNFKDNDRTTRARIAGLPNSDFTIFGEAEKRDLLNTEAGVEIEIMPGMMGHIGWSGVLNDRLGGHTAHAGLSYRW